MSVYIYTDELKSFINNLRLVIKYKNIRIDIMNYLPYLKKGYLRLGTEISILFDLHSKIDNTNAKCNLDIKHINNIDKDKDLYSVNNERDILVSLRQFIIYPNDWKFDKFKSNIPDIYEILKICIGDIKLPGIYNLLNIITLNHSMKLLYNIICNEFDYVKSNLIYNIACPFIGYSVSRLKNNEINCYVKSVCIERMWYIKQVLTNTDSDITKVILDYFNYLMK